VGACWELVARGIEYGLLDVIGLEELLAHVRAGDDLVVGELGFEFVAGALRVSLLDDVRSCSPAALASEVEALLVARGGGGSVR
jgi:hypothetical protein